MAAEDPNERRGRNNFEAILRFCVQNTKSEDAPENSSAFRELSPERKQFLAEVLGSLNKDPVKQMLELIKIIQEEDTDDNIESKETALADLQMLCEDIDNATDFYKIGGYSLLLALLRSSNPDMRWNAAELVATLVQNNPHCQKAVVDTPELLTLLYKALDEDEVDLVKVKALYAISCLSRDFPPAQAEFVKHDGFTLLLRAMQSDEEKLQIKAAFFFAALLTENPTFKDVLCDMGLVDQLVSLLSRPHSLAHEQFVRALLVLVTDHSRALAECQRPALSLKELLEEKLADLRNQETHLDEFQLATDLYNTCFPANTASGPLER